jgi:hypothetical protein
MIFLNVSNLFQTKKNKGNQFSKLTYFIKECPGTQSETAGKADACAGCPNQSICASGKPKEVDPGNPVHFIFLLNTQLPLF